MDSDNLMPNDSTFWFPREPAEQVIGRKKEKAQTLEGINELKKIVTRFEEQIAYYDSLSSIPDSVRLEPQHFLIMHNAHTQVVEILKSEKEYITGLISAHLK